MMNCTSLLPQEIIALDALPAEQLADKVTVCVCKQLYGMGSGDLTGIGVCISFLSTPY
jgi:hypothetical protein